MLSFLFLSLLFLFGFTRLNFFISLFNFSPTLPDMKPIPLTGVGGIRYSGLGECGHCLAKDGEVPGCGI